MNPADAEHEWLDELAESFLTRYRAGERPSLTEYISAHPDLEQEIRELFPALVVMEEFGSVAEAQPQSQWKHTMPEHLGDFQLLRLVGQGGMGVVYEAVQISLGRHVALKILPQPAALSPTYLERFRREARAAAQLHHENIVPVFGVGEHNGVHYFAMQFIAGQGLDTILDELRRIKQFPALPTTASPQPATSKIQNPDSAKSSGETTGPETITDRSPMTTLSMGGEGEFHRRVARLGVDVAEALDYAHRQGVLHRDIKPSNLLLDTQGKIWITDFGLAKVEGSGELTNTGDLVGTLRYMPPERLRGEATPASDVYSLGLTLYELVTLRPAFDMADRGTLLLHIKEQSPASPRQMDRRIPRDLETIILKAIEKEPHRRYPSAADLAADLRRFLSDQPIQAKPTTYFQRGWKWAKRRPTIALLAVSICFVVLLGIAGILWQWNRAETALEQTRDGLGREQYAKKELQEALTELQVRHYDSLIMLAHHAWQRNQIGEVQRLLGQCPEIHRGWEWHFLDHRCRTHLREWAIPGSRQGRYVAWVGQDQRPIVIDHVGDVHAVSFDPQSQQDVFSTGAPVPTKGDRILSTFEELQQATQDRLRSARSHDGRYFAYSDQEKWVRIWDLETKTLMAEWDDIPQPVNGLALSRDGSRLAIGTKGRQGPLRIWDVKNRQIVQELAGTDADVMPLALNHDASRLVTVGTKGLPNIGIKDSVRVWNIATGTSTTSLPITMNGNSLLATIHPQGTQIAIVQSSQVHIFEPTGRRIQILNAHTDLITSLQYSPDGKRLVTASRDQSAAIWDTDRWSEISRIRGHLGVVKDVRYSSTGDRLLTTSSDGTVRIWDALKPRDYREELIPNVTTAFPNPDGRRFIANSTSPRNNRLHFGEWLPAPVILTSLQQPTRVAQVCYTSTGDRAAIGWGSHGITIWNVTAQTEITALPKSNSPIKCFAFVLGGNELLTGHEDGAIERWSSTTGVSRGKLGQISGVVTAFQPSPDGNYLASRGTDGWIRFWKVDEGHEVASLPMQSSESTAMAFSSDGQTLAVADGKTVALWNPHRSSSLRTLHGHTAMVRGLAISADHRRLISAGDDRQIRIWNLQTGAELLALPMPRHRTYEVRFSADGKQLRARADDDTWTTIWE